MENKKKIITIVSSIIAVAAVITIVLLVALKPNKNVEQKDEVKNETEEQKIETKTDNKKVETPTDDEVAKLYQDAVDLCLGKGLKLSEEIEDIQLYDVDFTVIQGQKILNMEDYVYSIFSEDAFKVFTKNCKSAYAKDGYVYITNLSSYKMDLEYTNTELEYVSRNENKIEYTAKSNYIRPEPDKDGNLYTVIKRDFTIVYENGKWVIEEFTMPY